MGLFRSKEEKRQKSIRQLEELIAAYDDEKAPKWQRTYDIRITAIERLEKLVGTDNLSGDMLEFLLHHYNREGNEEAIDRILPAYSRYFASMWIGSVSPDGQEFSAIRLVTYLIGGEYEWELPVVVRPDLDLAMEYAERLEKTFYQEVVGQLKEAGYPGDTKEWNDRLSWMADHLDNPGVQFLYGEMLIWSVSKEDHIRGRSNRQLKLLKQYCMDENLREIVLKEWNRRFPEDK